MITSNGDSKKVLVVAPGPRHSTYDTFRYYTAAFRQEGYKVSTFDYHDWFAYYVAANSVWMEDDSEDRDEADTRVQELSLKMSAELLLAKIARTLPDIIFVISGIALPAGMWSWIREFTRNSKKKIVTSVLFTESPYIDDWQLEIGSYVDICCVMDRYSMPKFQAFSGKSMYVPHAYSPQIHYKREEDSSKAADVFMVGTGFPERYELLTAVNWNDIDLRLFGGWEINGATPVGTPIERFVSEALLDNEREVPHWYTNSKISLNIFRTARWPSGDEIVHIDTSEAYSMSPRCFEIMACGGLLLTNRRPELFDLFIENRDFVVYSGPQDLGYIVRDLLANPKRIEEIKRNAGVSVTPHSYNQRVRDFMKLVNDIT